MSDVKSKSCLCIGKIKLSSVHMAVCWLVTKFLSLCALQPNQAFLTWNNICSGLSSSTLNTHSVNLPGHLPLLFQNEHDSITHSIPLGFITVTWLGKKVSMIIWNLIVCGSWTGKNVMCLCPCKKHIFTYSTINFKHSFQHTRIHFPLGLKTLRNPQTFGLLGPFKNSWGAATSRLINWKEQ